MITSNKNNAYLICLCLLSAVLAVAGCRMRSESHRCRRILSSSRTQNSVSMWAGCHGRGGGRKKNGTSKHACAPSMVKLQAGRLPYGCTLWLEVVKDLKF